jgi:hypothetical protein
LHLTEDAGANRRFSGRFSAAELDYVLKKRAAYLQPLTVSSRYRRRKEWHASIASTSRRINLVRTRVDKACARATRRGPSRREPSIDRLAAAENDHA